MKEEPALLNVERNPLLLLAMSALTLGVSWYAWTLLKDTNPAGFVVAIPAGILIFQLLWLFLNPFGEIYKDRLDIRQSFVHRSTHYFSDIKKITAGKGPSLFITFHDDDIEKVSLKGIKPAHVELLCREMASQVAAMKKEQEIL